MIKFNLNLTISFEFPPFRVSVSLIKLPVKELHGDSFVFIEFSSAAIININIIIKKNENIEINKILRMKLISY